MKKLLMIGLLALLVVTFISFDTGYTNSIPGTAFNDSLENDRTKYIALISERIKGKEKMAVDSVFSNLKVLGGFPAQNLVFAMRAWSRGLGISCGHCHNTDDFSLDEKQPKEIAREMVRMGNLISEKLKTIKGLSAKPIVNCTTCHRGELKPALSIQLK